MKEPIDIGSPDYKHFATPDEAAIPYLSKEKLVNPDVWPTPEIMKTPEFK